MTETGNDNRYTIDEDATGVIQIADDVVASIVGLAVTEVDGVSKLSGDITREIIARLGKNNLSKGITITYKDDTVDIDISVTVKFGFNIVDVSRDIQDKVRQTLMTMTGLKCDRINVKISGIDFSE